MQADPPFDNSLIQHLSATDVDLLRPHLNRMELGVRHRLAEAHRTIDSVYFLEAGVASTAASLRHEMPIEIGITGREGVVNLPVVLGIDQSPSDTFMQIGGSGLGMGAAALRAAMDQSPSLTRWLLRFAHVFMVQTASTVLANGRATVTERLARWLLMAHDRIDGNGLALTHEFLAIMLGVRRSGVTVALRDLERQGLIDGGRGMITIVDREGLELVAKGYYGIAEAEMRRLYNGPQATGAGA